MKKNFCLYFALGTFVIGFISFFYTDVLFNRFFVLGLIVPLAAVLGILGNLVLAGIGFVKKRSVLQNGLSVMISLVAIYVLLMFPFRSTRISLELELFDRARTEVVDMVEKDLIAPDGLGNADLPHRYGHVSSDGTIYIYRNDEKQLIGFWVFRGMMSGSVELLYSSEDEALIYENFPAYSIRSIENLKDHWYLVETVY